MIKLNKHEEYDTLLNRLKQGFNNEQYLGNLQKKCSSSIELKSGFSEQMQTAAFNLILLATSQETGNKDYLPHLHGIKNKSMSMISAFLSFTSAEQVQQELLSTPYIDEDYIFNLLECSFYSLVVADKKISRRFWVAYTLWQHTVEFGCSGYSDKLGQILPYYLTYFGNKIFLVNPVDGWVKGFKRSGALFNKQVIGIRVGVKNGIEEAYAVLNDKSEAILVKGTEFGFGIVEVQETHFSETDRKEAERRRKREQGYEVEETCWLTTALDVVDGSAYNIRTHSLICLCVYGVEVMKYGIMECNSIFTVDHMNGIHDDNRIDNLQLLTRKSNDDKKECKYNWYFDYFEYWRKQIEAAKRVQEQFNYRKTKEVA